MNSVPELVKVIQQPRIAFAVWVTALLILLVPFPFLEFDESITKHTSEIKVIGLFAFVYWVVEACLIFWESHSRTDSEKNKKQEAFAYLETLNANEMEKLAVYLVKNQQTVRWPRTLDEIESLVSKGLLDAVPTNSVSSNAPFTMPRFVWDHLQKSKGEFIENAKAANPGKNIH